jgi:uncharacterized paraquat-inducible protein A
MSTVLCPQCGEENSDPEGNRSSNAFCLSCDYPLFFARGVVVSGPNDTGFARERLPGVAGVARRAWTPCPDCGELNPREATRCLRCGAILTVPEPEPVVAPQENTIIREVLVHGDVRKRWPWFLLGLLAGTVATILAIVIAGGIG